MVPVHPQDRLLLGMVWKGQRYVDGALPFGLRSAPKLFTALADALLWIMRQHGVAEAMHYLDDFLVFGAPNSRQCEIALGVSRQLCKELGSLAVFPEAFSGAECYKIWEDPGIRLSCHKDGWMELIPKLVSQMLKEAH